MGHCLCSVKIASGYRTICIIIHVIENNIMATMTMSPVTATPHHDNDTTTSNAIIILLILVMLNTMVMLMIIMIIKTILTT